MSANLLDARLTVVFAWPRCAFTARTFASRSWSELLDDPFPTRDGDIVARRDGEDAATHGAEEVAPSAARQCTTEDVSTSAIPLTRQDAKAAALILGPN